MSPTLLREGPYRVYIYATIVKSYTTSIWIVRIKVQSFG